MCSPRIHERDYISVSKIDHQVDRDVTLDMEPGELFADAGACMLMPAVDQGPLCKSSHVKKFWDISPCK